MKYVEVILTPAEAVLWDWAADPTIEMWAGANDEERDDGLHFDEDVIELSKPIDGYGHIGLIHPHKAVIDDMIYRLDIQLGDMTGNELIGGRLKKGSTHAKNHMSAMRAMRLAPKVIEKLRAIQIEFRD